MAPSTYYAAKSRPTIARIWKAFGLKPWREDTFKLSEDPLFVDKVRDVVGLYLNPPERAVLLSVDETTQVQALDRTQPILPTLPGFPPAIATTTSGTARSTSTPPWTSPVERCSTS